MTTPEIESEIEVPHDDTDASTVKPRGMSAEVYCEHIEEFRNLRDAFRAMDCVEQFSLSLDKGGMMHGDVFLRSAYEWDEFNDLLADSSLTMKELNQLEGIKTVAASDDGETIRTQTLVSVRFANY